MNKIFDFATLYFADDSADTPEDNKPTNTPPAPDKSDNDSGKDDKKYSDADVDKLLEKKFAKWQKQKEAEIKRVQIAKPLTEGFEGSNPSGAKKVVRQSGPAPIRRDKTPDRNDPCPCGSGKKYKKCCGAGKSNGDN